MVNATFAAFLTAYTLSQFYRSFLAVIAPDLAIELHLTADNLGQMSAAWFFSFAVAQFPLGAALDASGPRRVVPAFMTCGVLGAFLFSHALTSSHLVVAMGLIGIGCSPALMGAMFVFAREFPSSQFAFLSSMIIGLGSAGNLLGGSPLAYAAQAFGWRSVMAAFAVLTAASAIAVLIVVRDPPSLRVAGQQLGFGRTLWDILQIKALWSTWPLMAVGYAFLIAERSLWAGPYYSQVFGLNAISRGGHILLMAAAVVVGALAYGPIDRAVKKSKWLVFIGSIITASAFFALALLTPPTLWASTAALCIIGSAGMTYAVLVGHIRRFFTDSVVGQGITFANALCMGAAGIIQILSGKMVSNFQVQNMSPTEIFSNLHFLFGASLLFAAAVYVVTPSQPKLE